MLTIKTKAGSVYRSDLLELVDDAAGPGASTHEVVDRLIELINRLIRPAPGRKTEHVIDQFSQALCGVIAKQPIEVQTYVLLPVLDATHQELTAA